MGTKTLCVWVCFVVVMVGFDLLCTGSWNTVLGPGPLLILFEVGYKLFYCLGISPIGHFHQLALTHALLRSIHTDTRKHHDYFVVITHLKNISQIGNLPQVGVNIINIRNHHNPTIMLHHSSGVSKQFHDKSNFCSCGHCINKPGCTPPPWRWVVESSYEIRGH